MFEGFYKVRFQLGAAVGRSVMYARDGRMLGGNSAFAHIGTYEKHDDAVDIVVQTVRHNPDPNYRAMAGTDDATLLAKGRADGALYRFEGGLKELPGVAFHSVMTPIEQDAVPIAGSVGEGGVVNGLYSIHIRMLDGVEGGLTGKHETAPWNKFSYGVADRGASIRGPHSFIMNEYKGYLEDRRPNSQGDPYQIASQILKTIGEVPTAKAAAA